MPQTSAELADSITLLGDVNGQMEKHTRSKEQKVRLREVKYPKGEIDVNLSMDIDSETNIGEEHHLNSFNKSTLSILKNVSKKSERNVAANVTKNDYKMLDCLKETKTASLKEISTCPGLSKNKNLDLIVNTTKDGTGSSGNKVKPSREQLNSRESNLAKTMGEQISKNGKNSLAKGTSSPQVAGNHVIAAGHRQQVLRLIHYVSHSLTTYLPKVFCFSRFRCI